MVNIIAPINLVSYMLPAESSTTRNEKREVGLWSYSDPYPLVGAPLFTVC